MSLWRLYYHLVWSTKSRHSTIETEWEENLYHYIIGKADALSCITYAVNGMGDHIHLAVSIPPTLAIADFVRRIKGSSAHHVNHELSGVSHHFAWQAGYGVFSIGSKQLDRVVAYIENQKIHHQEGTIIDVLEQHQEKNTPPKRSNPFIDDS